MSDSRLIVTLNLVLVALTVYHHMEMVKKHS